MLKIVDCTSEYWDFVRTLRNDDRVQDGFIEKVKITTEQQKIYMEKNSIFYRICTLDNNPVGFVGVIENDIRICTHPDHQNKGIGKFMISKVMEIFPDAYGKVKINNLQSRNLFKSSGFEESFIIYTKKIK
jgi:hypothetical protein